MDYFRRAAAAAALASTLILGCAPTSPDSLRTDPGRETNFATPDDFLDVYQNEVHAMLNCMTGRNPNETGGNIQDSFAIQPRIDAAQKSATINYIHHFLFQDIWAVIDIKDNGSGSTVAAYTTSHLLMREFPAMVEKWAHGSMECPRTSPVMYREPIQE